MFSLGPRHAANHCRVSTLLSDVNDPLIYVATIDLDSHADTCTLSANFRVISYTEKECNVNGVLIVQAGTAYTHPDIGETIILVVNQGFYMGDIYTSKG